MNVITAAHDADIQITDNTFVRVHEQAPTARRGIEFIASVAPEVALRRNSLWSSIARPPDAAEPDFRVKP